MIEKELQKVLYEILEARGYRVYSDKQHPSIDWFPKTFSGCSKKPDLIVFHEGLTYCDTTKNCAITSVPSPIGIELKIPESFNEITKGIVDQMDRRYKHVEYIVEEEKWSGAIPLLVFATDESVINGHIDRSDLSDPPYIRINREPHTTDFVIERLLWRFGMGLIKKTKAIDETELQDGGEFKHIKLRGDFTHTNLTLSYDNNFIELCRL